MGPRPNILLITTDQQHFSALGAVNPKISTPNLDRLCRAGTRFDRAYCPNPVCTPSRASIITGQYPSHHGAWTIGVNLSEDVVTLPGLLGEAGYRTGLIGKAHFQSLAPPSLESQPTLRDHDFWRGFHGSLVRLRPYRACPQPRGREPRWPALRDLDGGQGPCRLARLLPAAASHA
jgi:arylsulfatase A-like enzyme